MKLNKVVLAETNLAYCDSTMEDFDKAAALRNLSFRASETVGPMEAAEIMTKALGLKSRTENGYNEFSPTQLLRLPKDSQIILAREGSVCVYVKSVELGEMDDEDCEELRETLSADECSVDSTGLVRIWWD